MVLGLLGMSLGSPGIEDTCIFMWENDFVDINDDVFDAGKYLDDEDDNCREDVIVKDDTYSANIVKKTIQKP